MNKLILSVVAVAFSAGAAFAADPMSSLYGNTLVVTMADGMATKLMYKPDHTFTGVDGKGQKISGTWAVDGDKVCATQVQPPPAAGAEKHCGPVMSDKKAGDKWEGTTPDGKKLTFELVKGA